MVQIIGCWPTIQLLHNILPYHIQDSRESILGLLLLGATINQTTATCGAFAARGVFAGGTSIIFFGYWQ